MKILLLNGSPRQNGNTRGALLMMQKMLGEGAELLDLCSMNLSGCLACNGCRRNGGHCVRPDDSDKLMQEIADADVVIFGTPVYWWGVSSQLKMAVDKFYSREADFEKMHKKIGILAVGGSGLDNPQYDLIRKQFSCIAEYLHWELAFSLSFSASEPGELLQQKDLEEQLKKACSRILI